MGSENADAGDPAGSAEDIAGHWRTFFELGTVGISSGYLTTQVRVSQHKAVDGKVDLQAVDIYDVSPVMDGGGTTAALPAQVTLCCTLTSEIQRGTGSKGRMYLPGIQTAVQGTTGKLLSSVTDNIRTHLKTMFDAINADADIPDQVILVSRGTKITSVPGGDISYINPHNKPVTGLRVGDVYDTQRRRRNGLTEAYSTAVLA